MDQISIFDFPEWLPEEDFQTMTSKRAAEIVGDRLGVKFKLYERYFENHFKAKKDGFEITIGFSVGFDGNRFLDTEVDHGSSCYGTPAKSIDDCVDSIKSYIEKESKKADKEKPICKYSKHSCNKNELWNVAQSLDNVFCPHVCCRKCSDKQCGARCNGADVTKQDQWKPAEEPTEVQREHKKVNIKGLMNYGYCPDCGGCNEDLEEECRYCGCLLDWSDWKRIEGMEDK